MLRIVKLIYLFNLESDFSLSYNVATVHVIWTDRHNNTIIRTSERYIFSPLWKIKVSMIKTGRTDYCGH
jgi:hypothetical protein